MERKHRGEPSRRLTFKFEATNFRGSFGARASQLKIHVRAPLRLLGTLVPKAPLNGAR